MAATLFLMVLLAAYSWRRRSVPGALPFMISCLLALLVVVGMLMTELAVDADTRLVWRKFMNAWMLPATTALTCFILEYAWPGRWLTKRNLVLLSIMPSLGVIYLLTDQFFQLVSPSFRISHILAESFGPVGGILFSYSLILSFIDLIVFIWLYIHSPQHRWPVFLMVTGQIISRVLLVARFPEVDGTLLRILSFAVPFITFAIALFRFRIFDPLPLARQTAIDQLHTGMIVLDLQGRVVSLNPSAERILGATTSQARNRPVRELLPDCSQDLLEKPPGIETECRLRSRCYTLSISQLKDFRGIVVGSLLMLRDITEQKHAQAQIVEQQRALATQIERERLARELHDSLGQVLSYTSLQVETSAQLSLEGQGDAAAAQLARLGSVVREAHADLREHILNLHSTASLEQPFLPAAKQYLDGFSRSYPIRTLLSADPALGEGAFTPDTKLQLLRILQEAVSNARKHGKARQVQVSILKEAGRLCMTIQDDGCGFHPQEVERSGDCHYGLQFMRDRAEALGGSLQVISAPGLGTRVILTIPDQE